MNGEPVPVTERCAGVESSVGPRLEPHDSLHEWSGRLSAERLHFHVRAGATDARTKRERKGSENRGCKERRTAVIRSHEVVCGRGWL